MRSPLLLLTLAISRIFSVAYIVPFAFVRLPENIYVSASAHNNNNGLRPTPCLVFPAHTFLSLDQSLPIAAQSEPTASSILVPRRHDAAALDGTRQPTASLHTILPSTTNSAVSKASPLIPTKIQPPPLSATDFSSTKVGAKYSAATISLRPKTKPHLLTDYEYETMWDPDVETLRFGVLLPLNAPTGSREHIIARKALSAIRLAINHVNRQKIVPGINMTLILRDSQDPDLFTITGGSAAISAASDLITAKVSGVIGDLRSSLTRYEALMTSSVGIPQCSFSSVSTTLSDMRVYPFFFRTIPTLIVILDSLLALVHTLGWRRISLIYDADTLGWSEREHFEDKAKEMGIYVLAAVPMTIFGKPYDPTFHHVKDKLQSSRSRIQVLIATQNNQFDFLREMKDSGYMSPKYAWITTNDVSSSVQQEKDSIPDYDGLIMIDNGWDLKGYGPFDNFLSEWQNLDPTEYPLAQDPILVNNEGMAYSCVMMIAQAYGKLIRSTITNPAHRMPTHPFIKSLIGGEHTGKVQVLDIFGNDSYSGPNGPISLDPSGDRKEGYFVFSSMRKGVSVQFAKHFFGDLILSSLPFFKDGYPNLLDDTPPGIIQNPRWTNPSGIILGILSIIGILLTLLSAALVVHYRNYIVIKATSPTFCICELFGILLMMVWCILRIGIPRHGECAAEVFILPIGGAFFAGSLAIKNYRIYRIFNSVKAIKQEFQTRTLIRYLVVAVILSTIPPVVQVIVEMPTYEELNIEAKQWIRCNGTRHQTQWLISSLAVPIVLIIFGVFLAFKTRNVMFLWNEAKQISFVIYNAFFFLIMIVASHFFPIEFYPATFYLTYIGIYSIALLSLLILFAPKFWEIWKSQHQTWTSSRALHIYSQHPHHLGGNGGGIFGSSNALGRVPDGLRANQSASMGSHDIPMSVLESPARTARTNSAHDALKNNIDGCTKPTTTSSNYTSYDIHGGDVTGPRLPALNNIKLQGSYTANSDGTRAIAAISDEPLYARVLYGRTLGTKTSEGSRMLESFVFLLPIRVVRNKFFSFLSHWFMATLILIPEAHLIFTVESLNGGLSSYLMLSMTQIDCDNEPTIQVTTSHRRTLLIRFPDQARLDYWVSLFSNDDLEALSTQLLSEIPTMRRSKSLDNLGKQVMETNKLGHRDMENDEIAGALPPGQLLHHPNLETGAPSKLGETSHSHAPCSSSKSNMLEHLPRITDNKDDLDLPTNYVGSNTCSNSISSPSTSRAHKTPCQSELLMQSPLQNAPSNVLYSDDSDDLYDPEFGIGGGGRRRRHGRRQSRYSLPQSNTIPSAAVISAAASAVSAGWSESEALAAAMAKQPLSVNNQSKKYS